MAGAQENSPATAANWAASGNGRRLRMSWSTQGSKGISTDQTSPEAAYSQPIGLAGRAGQDQPHGDPDRECQGEDAPSTSNGQGSGRGPR